MDRLSVQLKAPGIRGHNTENTLTDFGPPGPHQSGQRYNLTLSDVEGHILEISFLGYSLHLKDNLPDLRGFLRIHLIQFPSYHLRDQVVIRDLVHIPAADILRIPEYGNPGGQPVHVLELMGNKDNRYSLVPQILRDPVEFLAFVVRQRRGRLVHDHDPRIPGQGFGDLHQLLFCHRKGGHRLTYIQSRTQGRDQFFCLLIHKLPVIEAHLIFDLLPHKYIFRNRQIRECGHVLIDRRYSHTGGFQRGTEGNLFPL